MRCWPFLSPISRVSPGSVLDQTARDDDAHDLVGPFQNLVHAQVAHDLLDAVVGEIAISAEELQRVVGRLEIRDAPAERLALAHVAERLVERGLSAADR